MLKFTHYFEAVRQRADRAVIRVEWIQHVIEHPMEEVIQSDGGIRRWAPVPRNTFFDRSFRP